MSQQLHPLWTEKHKEYMQKALHSTISVAEGAVRAGKTVDNVAVFARLIDLGVKDRIHLATGSTVANAKLNIGDCNGFGLEHIFRGRCRWSKYKDNDALIIHSHGREYIVIFAGGGKADSYKKIRGNSYGLWIATEINLHHPDTIKEAFNRQLAATTRKVFWDLNPNSPAHWIYKDYIDKFEQAYGNDYTYQHFTIRDNASISERRLKEIEAQYDPGSIWYKRDILGIRCQAEGLVYPQFTPDIHIVDSTDIETEGDYFVSADYGIQNATVYLLWRKVKGEKKYLLMREYFYSGRDEKKQKTDGELTDDLVAWLGDIKPKHIIMDPSASSLIAAIRKKGYRVLKADNDVASGISDVSQLLLSRAILIDKTCTHTIEEFGLYCWDTAKTEKGEDVPVKTNDHCMDALRYFVKTKNILTWSQKTDDRRYYLS